VNLILFTDERKEQLEQSVSMLFHHQPQPFLSVRAIDAFTEHTNCPKYSQKLMHNPVGTTMSSLTRVSQMVQNQLYDAFVETGNGAVDVDEQRRAMESLMRLEVRSSVPRPHCECYPHRTRTWPMACGVTAQASMAVALKWLRASCCPHGRRWHAKMRSMLNNSRPIVVPTALLTICDN
jgi:hypothetical protein